MQPYAVPPGGAPGVPYTHAGTVYAPGCSSSGVPSGQQVLKPAQVPSRPLSPFAKLADKFLEAHILDASGSLWDVKLLEFFEAAECYRAVIAPMGTAVNLVLQDFDKNLQGCRAAERAEPQTRSTHRSLMQSEMELKMHTPGPGDRCGLKDPSGTCQMQWLLRGLHFFLTYIKYMFQGDSSPANKAYAETLQPYHKFLTSMGVKAAMMAMPGRDGVAGIQQLCPDEPDRTKAKEIVIRDGLRAAEVALPLITKMISSHREMGLWQDQQV